MKTYMSKKMLYEGRDNETIGGGFFVFRRGKKTGRVGVGSPLPFEHGTFESALKEARRLVSLFPEETFCVLQQEAVVKGAEKDEK